jgi:hypothetical protein
MNPFQDAGPSHSHSHSLDDTPDPMATIPAGAGRKRVGWSADASQPTSTQPSSTRSPDELDTGSAGHNTPLQRPDVTPDDLLAMRESIRMALAEEYEENPQVSEPVQPPRDIQKPRPAIRKGPRTPPEFYLNDQPNPFADDAEERPSLGAELKQRSGVEAQKRAARLSKSVGTYSAPVSRRNSHEMISPPVELRNMARTYDHVIEASDEEDDPQFMKRASMLLRQHTVRSAEQGLVRSEDLYHTDAPLRSGQVTPDETLEVEDERVMRPTKYRTGVLGTLLKASTAAQSPAPVGRQPPRSSHLRTSSTGTFSGESTAANSPHSSPPESGYSTPRAGRPWFNRQHSDRSATSISQLVGSSARSFATPAQHDLGHEFDQQYKKARPGMAKRSKSDESVFQFKKVKRRDNEIKIKIHL